MILWLKSGIASCFSSMHLLLRAMHCQAAHCLEKIAGDGGVSSFRSTERSPVSKQTWRQMDKYRAAAMLLIYHPSKRHNGAFKFRGACNAIFSIEDGQAAKGVVTHSSGNHAAAVALAAKLRGIPAYIVVPKNAPKCKVENVKRYGGKVFWSEATIQSRESVATEVMEEKGAILVHSFNDARIISGQGTISLELLEQIPQIDTIIVPISGGGLISGIALAAKSIKPSIRILAAEPRGANDAAQSKAAGRIVTLPETKTIADGLRAFLGDLTWPVVRDLVDEVIVVEDKEIMEAMRMCYEILKVAVEPSGAIGLAAVLSDSFQQNPEWKDCSNIGIIVSGGNVDLGILWESLNK